MKPVALITLFAATSVAAQMPTAASVLRQLEATHHFTEVALSPDGTRAAWVEELYASGLDTGTARIHLQGLGAPITAAPSGRAASEGGIAWAPDGTRIAFLSDAAHAGQMQLYVASTAGGPARQLTHLTGYLTDARWSPDGSTLAVLFAENAPSGGGPLHPEPPATGVIGAAIHNQRLAVVPAAGGPARQLTPASLNVYEYDWSPDGRRFAFTAAPGPGDNNWWIAQLYTASIDDGTPHLVFKVTDPQGQIAMPRWSPDGSTLAFIQGLMSDEGFTGGDLYTVPAAGGAELDRTPGAHVSVSSLKWITPQSLDLTEYSGGGSQLVNFDLATGGGKLLWATDQDIHNGGNFSNFSWSRDGSSAAYIQADWSRPPEIRAGLIGAFRAVTNANAAQRPLWGKAESLTWENGGLAVQGWLVYPRDYDAGKKYPLIVSVHGGPANINDPHWPAGSFEPTLLSALGYFVFFPNPRGSYGQGEAFTRANVKDFGYGDLQDILAGLDRALRAVPAIDPSRLGITGWSYGGYMTMWAITQTHRFRAAVAGAGLSDWLSYYGENSIDQWMTPYFGDTIYNDRAVYARSGPINFIKNVQAPTLLVVGERDGECPAPQSFEYWHALETLGVPTRLVVYPGEGHMFAQTAHIRDVLERTAAWFNQYLR